ncbi:MAG: hypothetical protein MI702_11880, partial [Chlorobiales bacterium]|nr:hypothetical protein [Chlorobiales bacterium]
MGLTDWSILALYFCVLIAISIYFSTKQKKGEDYFLGGKKIPWWLISMSLAANQVSAISLIGAPAFVAIKQGGGLKWLQYEFAVPLAMIAIMIILVPLYRRLSGVTIFEYLENRFSVSVRLILSVIFMIS